jgi:hypothetical protein
MFRRLAITTILLACATQPTFIPGTAAPAPPEKSALTLRTAHPPAKPGKTQRFVFEGNSATPIHRVGPEHFKLTRLSDGKVVDLAIAYDRDALVDGEGGCPREQVRRTPRVSERFSYNFLFKGVRLSLDTGPYDAKDEQLAAGQLHLYGRAKLAAGARYRLTWACWPVGAKEATELSCEFEVAR